MRESVIEAYLRDQVKAVGGEVRKVKWVGRRAAPDRIVMLPGGRLIAQDMRVSSEGLTVWVELKATGKKPETHQVREHTRMRKMGQTVVVIDSMAGVDKLLAGEEA